MKYKNYKTLKIYKRGFMATIAVVLLATSVMALSLSTMSAVLFYSDAIYKKELRIQARMNAKACLDTAILMVIKDYFLNGELEISEFDCRASITSDFNGNVSLNVKATLGGVSVRGKVVLIIDDNSVIKTDEEIW